MLFSRSTHRSSVLKDCPGPAAARGGLGAAALRARAAAGRKEETEREDLDRVVYCFWVY